VKIPKTQGALESLTYLSAGAAVKMAGLRAARLHSSTKPSLEELEEQVLQFLNALLKAIPERESE
jgi:hypothetical protein